MRKTKLLSILVISILLACTILNCFAIKSVNAAGEVNVTRNVYSNNGSMNFEFSGLELDTTHEYQFGLTKTAAAEVTNWYDITLYTATTATASVITTTDSIRAVINAVDTGYITIKDKTTDEIVLQPYAVNLKMPYLKVSNFTVVNNGKNFNYTSESQQFQIALRNAKYSTAYYQYEKITDQNIINKYKEIKSNNGDFNELENMISSKQPAESNWITWEYWNGHSGDMMNGYGYTQRTINVSDTGLYYMWLYFSGDNLKNLYGCVLVDNLGTDIALEKISLPSTKDVELGKTTTLTPIFDPQNTTEKIVTWSSSNEEVATVDNSGNITPKKLGTSIITVTSQDGKKKASCTITVVEAKNESGNNESQTTDKSHRYEIIEQEMTWEKAKEYCESKGGYLATITSADEQKKVEELIASKNYGDKYVRFWIGATDKETTGQWKWVTGEAFSYNNWGTDQPDSSEQHYAALINYSAPQYGTEKYQWDNIKNDQEDNITTYFICEYGDYETKTTTAVSTTNTTKDTTTATTRIPQTGQSFIVIAIIVLISVIGMTGFKFIRKNKDIK